MLTREERLLEALQAALEWIDAVPKDVAASLPAMPGFDRDDVEELVHETIAVRLEGNYKPVEGDSLYQLLVDGKADESAQADAAEWLKRFDDARRAPLQIDPDTLKQATDIFEQLYNMVEACATDSMEVASKRKDVFGIQAQDRVDIVKIMLSGDMQYSPQNPLKRVLQFAAGR